MNISPAHATLQSNTTLPITEDQWPSYQKILLAVDSSDHANHGIKEAITIASAYQSHITGTHVYAAKLHDVRFKQMEGGLPEPYQQETELERQRDIHDDLITKGLSVISDSYLDHVAAPCKQHHIRFSSKPLEGKNYRELTRETNSGQYDLLVLGALGLGAVSGSLIGTVCERVMRRTHIDTLIIKTVTNNIAQGPIVVAIDGSKQAYGGLKTALSIGQKLDLPVHVVSAFDPYYHYVAFNRIADVLSEEAGKIFKFKEQEKLHEEIIDDGLAKIYQGHLEVAESIAKEQNRDIETHLLSGKPYEIIADFVRQTNPSLLVMGKTGIHADADLDIGGNSENLVRMVDCSVLLSLREFQPNIEVLAEATISWSVQAQARLLTIPSMAQGMAKLGILRFAQQKGHTIITEKIVDEATQALCPVNLKNRSFAKPEEKFNMVWQADAETLLQTLTDETVKMNLKLRAEKKARQQDKTVVSLADLQSFMAAPQSKPTSQGKCPFGFQAQSSSANDAKIQWTDAALERLNKVPAGFMRTLTQQRVETYAKKHQQTTITPDLMNEKYMDWNAGSQKQSKKMPWDNQAAAAIDKIPEFVRGMVIKEIEKCATEHNLAQVDLKVLKKAQNIWADKGEFHTENNPDLYQS